MSNPEGNLVINVPAKPKGPIVWQKIAEGLETAEVPGGHLYKTEKVTPAGGVALAMVFVPEKVIDPVMEEHYKKMLLDKTPKAKEPNKNQDQSSKLKFVPETSNTAVNS